MMNRPLVWLESAPFIRLVIPLAAGIVVGDQLPSISWWLWLIAFSLLLGFLSFQIKIHFSKTHRFAILLIVTLFLFGGLSSSLHRFNPPDEAPTTGFAQVLDDPIERSTGYQFSIAPIGTGLRILAFISKSDSIDKIHPGTLLWYNKKPTSVPVTNNPFSFDYRQYLRRQQIAFSVYLKKEDYRIVKSVEKHSILTYSLAMRRSLIAMLEKSGLSGESLHLASSITLGARDDLEPETTQAFTRTGVVHVLAVSGMNVGIVYLIILFLFKPFRRMKWIRPLFILIALGCVWSYTLVTGMSASILRASMMFTFIIFGQVVKRETILLNMIGVSAFILLMVTPSLLYDVGFQLSCVALLSIVVFYPPLYGLLKVKIWVVRQIWMILAGSTAAQIGTLPLTIHYFHQFPSYFLIANLLVVPLVSILLYLTLTVIVVLPLTVTGAHLLGILLGWMARWMLTVVQIIEKMPGSLITDIYIPPEMILLSVFALLMLYLFVSWPNKLTFTAMAFVILLFCGIRFWHQWAKVCRTEVVVYSIKGKFLLGLTRQDVVVWFRSKNLSDRDLKRFTADYLGYREIRRCTIVSADSPDFTSSGIRKIEDDLWFEGLRIHLSGTVSNQEYLSAVDQHLDQKTSSLQKGKLVVDHPQWDILIMDSCFDKEASPKRKSGKPLVVIGQGAMTPDRNNPPSQEDVFDVSGDGAVVLSKTRSHWSVKNSIKERFVTTTN